MEGGQIRTKSLINSNDRASHLYIWVITTNIREQWGPVISNARACPA